MSYQFKSKNQKYHEYANTSNSTYTVYKSSRYQFRLPPPFSPSETSQAAGHQFLERYRSRTIDRDVNINDNVAGNQLTAIGEWGQPLVEGEERFAYLRDIKQPVLVVNGNNDVIVPTINSYHLQQYLPNATLILFPDSNHGSQYQYPEEFLLYANNFLNK